MLVYSIISALGKMIPTSLLLPTRAYSFGDRIWTNVNFITAVSLVNHEYRGVSALVVYTMA